MPKLWIAPLAAALLLAAAPQQSGGGLTVTLTLDKAAYTVGDDIQAEVRIENAGEADVEAVLPVFEERSVSFHVKASWEGQTREFGLAVARPDPHVSLRLAPARAAIAKGRSLSMVHRIPVLAPGGLEIQAIYQNGDQKLTSMTAKADATGTGLAAVLDTTSGAIRIDLEPAGAPAGVANFVTLARRGFYDDSIFHRVIKGSWIQGGCPYGLGIGGPGYAVRSDATSGAVHDAGTVSLSSFEKSGYTGSQFFICLSRLPSLDGKFAVLGKVDAAGMETVQAIGRVDVDRSTDRPKTDVKIRTVSIVVR